MSRGRRRAMGRAGIGHLAAAALLSASLAACAPAVSEVSLDGTLTVLEPRHDFALDRLANDWLVVGEIAAPPSVLADADNRLYLGLVPGAQRYALIKRVQARLLATPYLAWNWRLAGPGPKQHPAQLTVGFADTGEQRSGSSLRTIMGRGLPAFSRTLNVAWGHSALQRGSLQVMNSGRDGQPTAVYISRGGRENLGRWWPEAIDLSALHAKAWPGLDTRDTRIVFVGIVMRRGPAGSRADLSALRLYR